MAAPAGKNNPYNNAFTIQETVFRRELEAQGCPPGKMVVHHNTADPDRFAPGVKQNILLFAGRWTEKKGIGTLIAALARLGPRLKDWRVRLLGDGDFWWMLPITLATGFSAGGFAALPNSMKADVIDLDTLSSGENRAATFFSVWSFTQKLAGSLGGWVALTGLALIGFNATPGAANGADELFGLRGLFAVLPSIFYFSAAALISSTLSS